MGGEYTACNNKSRVLKQKHFDIFFENSYISYQCKPVFSNCSLARVLRRLQYGTFLPNLCGSTGFGASRMSGHLTHVRVTSQDLPNLWGMLGVELGDFSSPGSLHLPKRRGMLACRWSGLAVGG